MRRLKALEGMMGKKFVVLVCGKMKSGKSSLINGLIGEELLDAKILPTAMSVSELHYGKEKKIDVYTWENGRWNENRDVYVEPTADGIRNYKETFMESGLVLVEIPDTSYVDGFCPLEQYLSFADAVIYAVDISRPYSREGLEILSEINNYDMERIISVITRCDVLDSEEGCDVEKIRLSLLTAYQEEPERSGEYRADWTINAKEETRDGSWLI